MSKRYFLCVKCSFVNINFSEMYFAIVASNNNLPLVKQKKKENYQKQKKFKINGILSVKSNIFLCNSICSVNLF